MALRIPLIGGFNASPEDARGFAELFGKLDLGDRATVELLTYHEYGKDKYEKLGMEYTMDATARVSRDALDQYKMILRDAGINIIHT